MDISEKSYEELGALKDSIEQELINRRRYILGDTCRQIRVIVDKSGLVFDDVLAALQKPSKPTSPIKFRHPQNRDLTWAGKGKKPFWLAKAIEDGADLEDFAVK